MDPKEMTPEERLLALIRKKNKQNASAAPKQPAETAGVPEGVALTNKSQVMIRSALESGIFDGRVFHPERMRTINRYLVFALVGVLILFIAEILLVKPPKDIASLAERSPALEAGTPILPRIETITSSNGYSAYAGDIAGKNIFGQPSGQTETPAEQGESPAGYGLVGILSGDEPMAIIEDKKNEKTYRLRKGQAFEEYVVEEILPDKVILDMQGKKTTLYL